MRFGYSKQMQHKFPTRGTGVMGVYAVSAKTEVATYTAPFMERAKARLSDRNESALRETQAWRAAYRTMGSKPTQYRCATKPLLRRFRQRGSLPAIHPLIDLCNGVSLAFATPIAVFDMDHLAGDLTDRHADGTKIYQSFSGNVESTNVGEVIFEDDGNFAHAGRWANRQSRRSAVSDTTTRARIVMKALHHRAQTDVEALMAISGSAVKQVFGAEVVAGMLATPEVAFVVEDGEPCHVV